MKLRQEDGKKFDKYNVYKKFCWQKLLLNLVG